MICLVCRFLDAAAWLTSEAEVLALLKLAGPNIEVYFHSHCSINPPHFYSFRLETDLCLFYRFRYCTKRGGKTIKSPFRTVIDFLVCR